MSARGMRSGTGTIRSGRLYPLRTSRSSEDHEPRRLFSATRIGVAPGRLEVSLGSRRRTFADLGHDSNDRPASRAGVTAPTLLHMIVGSHAAGFRPRSGTVRWPAL